MTKKTLSEIQEMLAKGELQKVSAIAKEFGLKCSTIDCILDAAGVQRVRNTVKARAILRGSINIPPLGRFRHALEREPANFVAWLLSETPDGCTMAETLIAIARDAYADAMETKTGKAA